MYGILKNNIRSPLESKTKKKSLLILHHRAAPQPLEEAVKHVDPLHGFSQLFTSNSLSVSFFVPKIIVSYVITVGPLLPLFWTFRWFFLFLFSVPYCYENFQMNVFTSSRTPFDLMAVVHRGRLLWPGCSSEKSEIEGENLGIAKCCIMSSGGPAV